MKPNELESYFITHFPHAPTAEQKVFFSHLAQFIFNPNLDAFLLSGYAGTGKTALMASVVKTYQLLKGNLVLLAPTGRAGKVLAQRTGKTASTIHRYIYMAKENSGMTGFSLRPNKSKHTLYVVDEASMITDHSSDNAIFGNRSLLDDLVRFVQMGHKCKLLFIGDLAQLPPVGLAISPALNPQALENTFGLRLATHKLTQVIRQAAHSGVLQNATLVRQHIAQNQIEIPKLLLHQDVVRLTDGWQMEEVFQQIFSDSTAENGIMIVRSNNRANKYNLDIRARIQFKDDIVAAGDRLMVVKNNYFWLPNQSKAGFIANGDTLEVLSIRNRENQYGFEFVDATVQLLDYPEEPALDVKLLLDTLQADAPALTHAQQKRLFDSVEADYQHLTNRKNRMEAVMNNPYYQALQVKFAHVVTCHKAQGGQWPIVIIEQSWLPDGEIDREYLRWLYTALTRAEQQVFLIGFDDRFFEE